MHEPEPRTLRSYLLGAEDLAGKGLFARHTSVALTALASGTSLGDLSALADRRVLVATHEQLAAAQALIDLDGVARRILLAPPDLRQEHLAPLLASAEIDAIVTDGDGADFAGLGQSLVVASPLPVLAAMPSLPPLATEWVLLTSGTTGVPKMVVHDLAGLTAAIRARPLPPPPIVWATFYDIRRYGGLQIFLRAILGRASLVLSDPTEPGVDHLHRLAACGVTHISGTPSHWRRALMSQAAAAIAPRYVRLSGEIADQAVLDSLRQLYPAASIGHAYASTEAGVGFEVDDGLEGFPDHFLGRRGDVEMKVLDGSLRIRSNRMASRYVGAASGLAEDDGFVDTGDMVERRGNRYFFVGRRGGIINVGGLKVHPEEVEAVINGHRNVRMSLVKSRKSPIMGAIVIADVVLHDASAALSPGDADTVKGEILSLCRSALPAHKIPATIRFVAGLEVTQGGKLARQNA